MNVIVKPLKDPESANKSHEVQTLKNWQILTEFLLPSYIYKIGPDFLKLREGKLSLPFLT